jgi:hypothetical protein
VIAALFVQTGGCYFGLEGVDPWDEPRDARKYAGPHPVVAHPPCHLWVNFAALNFKRYGGEHNRPGNDGECFASALASVQCWGGVLEHPAESKAWREHGLVRPSSGAGWTKSLWADEWVCEVWQSAYDHLARKKTWIVLYSETMPHELRWARREGTHQIGWFDRKKPVLGKRAAAMTPLPFARELVRLARRARLDTGERKAA